MRTEDGDEAVVEIVWSTSSWPRWRYADSHSEEWRDVEPGNGAEWLREIGVDPHHAFFGRMSDSLEDIASQASRTGWHVAPAGGAAGGNSMFQVRDSSMTTQWAMLYKWTMRGSASAPLLLWLAGCWYIARRTGKDWTPPVGGEPAPDAPL